MNPVYFSSETSVSTKAGDFKIDLYKLLVSMGWGEDAVIALPNIPRHVLSRSKMKTHLRNLAGSENLDLEVIFPSFDGKELDRWSLGHDDGICQRVYVFTKEFFSAGKPAWEDFLGRLPKIV